MSSSEESDDSMPERHGMNFQNIVLEDMLTLETNEAITPSLWNQAAFELTNLDRDPFCKCYEDKIKTRSCECGEYGKKIEWVWDTDFKSSSIKLLNDNKDAIFHPYYSDGTAVIRGAQPMTDNQHYFEVKMISQVYGTDMMVGVGTNNFDVYHRSNRFCSLLGRDKETWGLSFTGNFHHNGNISEYAPNFSQGSIIGVHLDLWNGSLSFYKNRIPLGIASTGLKGKTLYGMVSSTAARSRMRIIRSCSFPTSLQFLCCVVLRNSTPADRNVLDVINVPPGLKNYLQDYLGWLLGEYIPNESQLKQTTQRRCMCTQQLKKPHQKSTRRARGDETTLQRMLRPRIGTSNQRADTPPPSPPTRNNAILVNGVEFSVHDDGAVHVRPTSKFRQRTRYYFSDEDASSHCAAGGSSSDDETSSERSRSRNGGNETSSRDARSRSADDGVSHERNGSGNIDDKTGRNYSVGDEVSHSGKVSYFSSDDETIPQRDGCHNTDGETYYSFKNVNTDDQNLSCRDNSYTNDDKTSKSHKSSAEALHWGVDERYCSGSESSLWTAETHSAASETSHCSVDRHDSGAEASHCSVYRNGVGDHTFTCHCSVEQHCSGSEASNCSLIRNGSGAEVSDYSVDRHGTSAKSSHCSVGRHVSGHEDLYCDVEKYCSDAKASNLGFDGHGSSIAESSHSSGAEAPHGSFHRQDSCPKTYHSSVDRYGSVESTSNGTKACDGLSHNGLDDDPNSRLVMLGPMSVLALQDVRSNRSRRVHPELSMTKDNIDIVEKGSKKRKYSYNYAVGLSDPESD